MTSAEFGGGLEAGLANLPPASPRLEVGLPLTIRNARREELSGLSDLCFRSKAVWGYDAAFMDACRHELTFDQHELQSTSIAVAELDGNAIGVAQVKVLGSEAELLKLFVEPAALRKGIGRTLLNWAIDVSKAKGAVRLTIDADPDAVPFYLGMGARHAGEAPSGSIPGRTLPRLTIGLRPRSVRSRQTETKLG